MRQTEKEQKDSEKGKQEDTEFLRTEPLGKLLLETCPSHSGGAAYQYALQYC